MIIEYPRFFEFREMRAEGDGSPDNPKKIVGYAAVFNSETVIGNAFREVIRPGAFRKTLAESDQIALWNHDSNFPLGRKSAGTLKLDEDGDGLRMEITPPNNVWGLAALESVSRGDVTGASFQFSVVKETISEEDTDMPLRALNEVRLMEVSPVAFPAYPETKIAARALELRAAWTRESTAVDRTTPEPVPNANHSVEPDGKPKTNPKMTLLQMRQRMAEVEV